MKKSLLFRISVLLSALLFVAGCAIPLPQESASLSSPENAVGAQPLGELFDLDESPDAGPTLTPLPSNHDATLTQVNTQVDQSSALPGSKPTDDPSVGVSSGTTDAKPSTGSLSSPLPSIDIAVPSGDTFTFRVTAPADARVQLTFQGKTYSMKREKKGSGMALYTAEYRLPSATGTVDLGKATYAMELNGRTSSATTEGSLFVVGEGSQLRVQVKNPSATSFRDPKTRGSGFITTLKKGAIDYVTDYYGNMYRLSSVGWVDASAVQPLTTNVPVNNTVSAVTFEKRPDGEAFILHGTTHPPYRVAQNKERLGITFARTSGIGSVPTADSQLFSSVDVSTKDGATTLTFNQRNPGQLGGYLVEYSGGKTTILARKKPETTGDGSLSGLTILVDPGHGGQDQGAAGLGASSGKVEKHINLTTAKHLEKELQKRGANVIMTRSGDSTISLNDRLALGQQHRVDYAISIHANSAPGNPKASGVEVYYYEPIAGPLASNISTLISRETGRTNRGAKHSCYVVTLNSYAPSVLIEMGFMTNKEDFVDMHTQKGIDQTVNGIVGALVHEVR